MRGSAILQRLIRSLLPRLALALVSLLLVAWFAVLARDERSARQAETRILRNPEMSAADWSDTMDQLRAAELLNPGTPWKVSRASANVLRGNKRLALRVADSVVADEPDNLAAWIVVLRAATGLDRSKAAQARAQIRRLNPRLASQDR